MNHADRITNITAVLHSFVDWKKEYEHQSEESICALGELGHMLDIPAPPKSYYPYSYTRWVYGVLRPEWDEAMTFSYHLK